MTMDSIQTLEEAIDDALATIRGANVNAIVTWIRLHYRRIFDENLETLGAEGLAARVRARRKVRAPEEEDRSSFNLCLDFGLPNMNLDSEISIPQDEDNPLYGPCEWKEPDDATLCEVRKHAEFLRIQGKSMFDRADSWDRLCKAAEYYADGNDSLTIGELRRRARRSTEQS